MAYRVTFDLRGIESLEAIAALKSAVPELARKTVEDGAERIATYGKEHLSGVPFTSKTGTHVIQKRTGRGAASIESQYPYGSPFRARVFASAMTRYANNPEEWNYLAVLEFGRGEIRPKYTPSMVAGQPGRARLTIPGGPHQLVNGENNFRGISGRYSFARTIPPMAGKYWFAAAVERATPEIREQVDTEIRGILSRYGL